MNATVYICGILLQAVAAFIALLQLRHAEKRLPWLLISLSSLLIVVRRSATLGEAFESGGTLAAAEILTLVISLLFFFGVILMTRSFREMGLSRLVARRNEAVLGETSAYNRSLLEASPDPFIVLDTDGRIADVNLAAESMTEMARDKLRGMFFTDCFTDPERAGEGRRRVLRAGAIHDLPLEIKRRGGALPVLCNASLYRDDAGAIHGIFAVIRDHSAIRNAEAALLQSEQAYRMVAEFTADWEYWLAPDGSLPYVSPSCARITGYGREEFLHDFSLLIAIVDAEDRAMFIQHCHEYGHPDNGGPAQIEFRIRTKSGACIWIGHSCQGVFGDDGVYLGRRVSNRDITVRKKTESELVAVSAYNRGLLEVIPDPLVTIGADGRITDANHATGTVTGCPRSGLVGADFSGFFTEPELVRKACEAVFRDGQVRDRPLVIRHRDGRTTQVLCNATVYRNARGETAGAIVVIHDISVMNIMEEEIIAASAYNRCLLEASLDPLVTIGPDGCITDVNPATETVTGRARADLIGSDFSDIFTEPEKARVGYQEVFRFGSVRDYPLEIRHCNGRTTPVLYNATVYRDSRGEIQGIFAAARDISATRQAEAERKQLADRFGQQQKMAAVGTLANGVAHEINNPLTGVINFAQLVLDGLPATAEREKAFCAEIIGEGKRIAGIVRNLLAFSGQDRPGSGEKSLAGMLDRILALTGQLFRQEGIAIETEIAPGLPPVRCAAQQIEHVIFNLLANARTATMDGVPENGAGRRIRIELGPHREEGQDFVRLSIRDYGPGIAEENRSRIFEPFFTTGDQSHGSGTGLGLSSSYGIVSEHRGRLWFETWSGAGTVFHLALPVSG